MLLEGGRTCHSRLGLPVPMPREAVCSSIKAQSNRAEVLRRGRLLVWDEAPMAPWQALECVDMTLRDLTGIDFPFGGKVVVLGGEFRQVLPVMPHSTRADVVSHSIKAHELWLSGFVSIHHLSQNMRAREDSEWSKYLLEIGDDVVPVCEAVSPFAIRIPDNILAPPQWSFIDLVRHVFPGLSDAARQSVLPNCPVEVRNFFCERAILTATNAIADLVNDEILQEIYPSTHKTYYSVDDIDATTPEIHQNTFKNTPENIKIQ